MIKIFLPLLLINMYIHLYAQSDVSTAKFMHVTVDGNNSEWGSLNFYDDQTQLNFGIANDDNNIYLCFATTSEPVEMKLMRAGMKLTLSTKGKFKREASILFPLPQTKQSQFKDSSINDNNNSNARSVFNKETFRQNYIANHTIMQVSGFSTVNGEVSIKDSVIQAAVNWDSASNLVYEVAIAKKEFFGAGYNANEAIQNITLSVEVNALPRSERGYDGGNNSSNSNFHGGMHGGGTRGGGGMHGSFNNGNGKRYGGEESNPMNNANNTSLSTKTSFKQKFVLNNGSN